MSPARFYLGLAIVLALAILFQWALEWGIPELQGFSALGYTAMDYFAILSIVIYYLSKWLGHHENPFFLLYLTYAVILFKLATSVVIVYLFKRLLHPTTRYFVLPFIIVYVLFTIFETAFMAKSGRLSSQDSISKS